MGNLTLADYQEEVLVALGNLSLAHPAVVKGLHTRAINDAANDLIRWYPDRFPEHNNNSWTLGPTTVGDNRISLIPSTILVIDRVRRPKDADAVIDPSEWADTNEIVVTHSSVETIGLLNKDASQTGYPRLYDRKGNYLLYHPTTRAGYTSYLRIYGLAGEERLVLSGDTFRMGADFDEAISLLAASKLAMKINRTRRGQELEIAVRQKVQGGISVVGREVEDRVMHGFEFGGSSTLPGTWGGW